MKNYTRSTNGGKWCPKTLKTTSRRMGRSITGTSSIRCGHCTSQRIASMRKGKYRSKKNGRQLETHCDSGRNR